MPTPPRIAVLVPCLNEEAAIGSVVAGFRASLPTADVYVYDNRSTDRTIEVATAAGAIVRRELRPGKGNVVRRMFQDVDADVYVMVDGDDTYDAAVAGELVDRLIDDNLDMVVGKRIETHQDAYRPGHRLGNRVLTGMVRRLFGRQIDDMLSGYRVFSRRFVKSFPSSSREFEIETELTVHALQMKMAIAEVDTDYKERPPGSASKLRTFRDGWRILLAIMNLMRNERPLLFFTLIGAVLFAGSLALGIPLVIEYGRTGLVPRFPTAILCTGLALVATVCIATGLVLDAVSHVRREAKRLAYLQHPAPADLRVRPEDEPARGRAEVRSTEPNGPRLARP
jgi:glycosyltransferase involved in cell wall biosynthesis